MAVFKKKRSNGTLSENWYYKFVVNGQRYKGSTYKSDKNEAEAFEDDLKRKIRALYDDRPVVSENEKERNLLNFREKITSEIQGESIKLDEVWDVFKVKAPALMRRIPNEKGWAAKKSYWEDFLEFLKQKHSNCRTIRDVRPSMAQEYVSFLKTSGKFKKVISYKGREYESKITQLSSSSINEYITQIKQIFRILASHAGLLDNPFDAVQKLTNRAKKREVFEIHELEKIDSFLKMQKVKVPEEQSERFNHIINEAVFTIGVNTGLRKGDICLLKWANIDFHKKSISMELSKTKESVFIPISSALFSFLAEKKKNQQDEYVTPQLARMYKVNAEGISYRFKKMLSHLGIESVKSYEGRSRKLSCKDIHSLRHTFCYLHGMQGTPLVVVQSMVGHMDKKMTESYMMHQTEELKRDAIEKLASKSFIPALLSPLDEKRRKLIQDIENCSEDELNKIQLSIHKKPDSDDNSSSFKMKW